MKKQTTKAQLELELIYAKQREHALLMGLNEIRDYLSLSKFHQDTTVQVSDIFHRIEEIKSYHFSLLTNGIGQSDSPDSRYYQHLLGN